VERIMSLKPELHEPGLSRHDRRRRRDVCRSELDTYYADLEEERAEQQRRYDEWNAWDAAQAEREALREQRNRQVGLEGEDWHRGWKGEVVIGPDYDYLYDYESWG
jgi:single-stranded DNA-specific DHH superfamily exonuclease